MKANNKDEELTQPAESNENKSYEDDIQYTQSVTRGVLRIIGVWPVPDDYPMIKRFLVKLQKFLCLLILYFVIVPGLMNICLKETDPKRRFKSLGPVFNCMVTALKLHMLHYQEGQIAKCLKYMRDDWQHVTFADRKIMMHNARFGRNIAVLCVSFVYGSGFAYRVAAPLTRGTIVTPDNITIRPLAYGCYFIVFNPQITPAYEIIFLLQFGSGVVHYAITSGLYCLMALFVLHGCGQLQILMARMRDFTENSRNVADRELKMKVAVIIERQVRVKTFLKEVESTLQHVCLVEEIGCTLVMCHIGYTLIVEWKVVDAVGTVSVCWILVSHVINIFTLCFIGELLIEQGTKVFITSSTLDWYYMPMKTARNLVLIINISSQPVKLTARKLFDLSLTNFVAVIKTAVAYLNILRTVIM